MSVHDGAAEGDVIRRVAITPHGPVASGQHKLELARAGCAEDGNTLPATEATVVFAPVTF